MESHEGQQQQDEDETESMSSSASTSSSTLQQLQTRVILHLQADNLPRWGIRRALPDTYALVQTRGGDNMYSSSREAQQDHQLTIESKRTEM